MTSYNDFCQGINKQWKIYDKGERKPKRRSKRGIKLFGRTIPISVILVFVLTVGVALAFFSSLMGTMTVTGRAGPTVLFDNLICGVQPGTGSITGIVTNCELTGSTFSVAVDNFDPGNLIKVTVDATPDRDVTVGWIQPDPLDPMFGRYDCVIDGAGTPCEGQVILNGQTLNMWWYVEIPGIGALEVVPDITGEMQFHD